MTPNRILTPKARALLADRAKTGDAKVFPTLKGRNGCEMRCRLSMN